MSAKNVRDYLRAELLIIRMREGGRSGANSKLLWRANGVGAMARCQMDAREAKAVQAMTDMIWDGVVPGEDRPVS